MRQYAGLVPDLSAPYPVLGVAPALVLVAGLFVLAPALAYVARESGWSGQWYLLAVVVPTTVASRVIGSSVAFGGWRPLRSMVRWSGWADLRASVFAFYAAVLATATTQGIASLVVASSRAPGTTHGYFPPGRPWPLGVIALLYSLIGAPVGEELLFRGVIQRFLLARRLHPAIAIGVSSVLFGADHYLLATHDPIALAGYVGVGLALGVVAWSSGRLAPTIAAHALYNISRLF